ncbi:MAG: tail fiber protein [bacterium]
MTRNLNTKKSLKFPRNGLTISEVLVVMVLFGVIAVSSIPAFTSNETQNRDLIASIGSIMLWAGNGNPPPNFVECNGQSLNKADYPLLFGVIGNTYGSTATKFNVPDIRGRAVIGAGQGTDPSPYSGVSPNLTLRNFKDIGGTETVTLTAADLPNHAHGVTDPGHTHSDAGHAHSVADYGHSHVDWGHVHSVWDGGHSHYYDDIYYAESMGYAKWISGGGANPHGYNHPSPNGPFVGNGQGDWTDFDNGGHDMGRWTNASPSNLALYPGYANLTYNGTNVTFGTGYANLTSNSANLTIVPSGGSNPVTPHNNLSAALVLKYVIKAR